jgi:hypothetical protein
MHSVKFFLHYGKMHSQLRYGLRRYIEEKFFFSQNFFVKIFVSIAQTVFYCFPKWLSNKWTLFETSILVLKTRKRISKIFTSHLMAIWISSQSDIAFDDRTPKLLLQIIRDKECIIWRFCQKESNKCKVTAEEDFLLSIESIWNRN